MSARAVPAVRVDPATGHKLFNTRAARSSARIAGKGYDVVDDPSLSMMPEMNRDARFDAEARARNLAFNEARRGSDD